jgi:AhpC/TSA family
MRFICVIVLMAAGLCCAGPDSSSKMVFNDLEDAPRRPLDPADKIASVLVFYWQDCPVSNSYAPELNRIAASHTNFAFYIVQVDPELTRAAAREHARKFKLNLAVLLDPAHQLVKYTQATVTPEAVVIGKSGQVLYHGRIDDGYAAFGKKRAAATEHDLIEALNALASGKPLKKTETKAIGCLIQ